MDCLLALSAYCICTWALDSSFSLFSLPAVSSHLSARHVSQVFYGSIILDFPVGIVYCCVPSFLDSCRDDIFVFPVMPFAVYVSLSLGFLLVSVTIFNLKTSNPQILVISLSRHESS